MGNKNYLKGVRKERKLVNEARAKGCLAFRSAGSHSPIDVFILDPVARIIHLVQCKPKSMSKKAQERLKAELKWCDGTYSVTTWVST